MEENPQLTIAIPIHGAERWIPGIVEIVGQAPEWSRVVISDASGLDRAAERLAELFRGDPAVEVIERSDRLDWVSHCNLLLEEAETEYFCWFPQDDLPVSDLYFERLVEVLRRDPDVVVSVPTIFSVYGRGRINRRPEFLDRRETGLHQDPDGAGFDYRVGSHNRNSLGVVWKGIFRRASARPMPVIDMGTSSDIVWSFSMALSGRISEVSNALYLKRTHRKSATYLMDHTAEDQLRSALLAEVESRFPEGEGARNRGYLLVDQFMASHALLSSGRPGLRAKALRRLLNQPRPYFE